MWEVILMFCVFRVNPKTILNLCKIIFELEYAIVIDQVILEREVLSNVVFGDEVAFTSGHQVEFSQLFVHFYYFVCFFILNLLSCMKILLGDKE